MPTKKIRALPFGISGVNDRAEKSGDYQIHIDLADGRTAVAFADRVEVKAGGALQLTMIHEKDGPTATMGFAPGQWLSYYISSTWDMLPIALYALDTHPPGSSS